MKLIKGILFGFICIIFLVDVLGLIESFETQGSSTIPQLAALGLLLTICNLSIYKKLYIILQIIFSSLLIIGLVSMFISIGTYFTTCLQILVGGLIIITSIIVIIPGDKLKRMENKQ